MRADQGGGHGQRHNPVVTAGEEPVTRAFPKGRDPHPVREKLEVRLRAFARERDRVLMLAREVGECRLHAVPCGHRVRIARLADARRHLGKRLFVLEYEVPAAALQTNARDEGTPPGVADTIQGCSGSSSDAVRRSARRRLSARTPADAFPAGVAASRSSGEATAFPLR
jgi:hypothetical protein